MQKVLEHPQNLEGKSGLGKGRSWIWGIFDTVNKSILRIHTEDYIKVIN